MAATKRCFRTAVYKSLVSLLLILTLVTACTGGIGSVETERRSWRRVDPIIDTGSYDFGRYLHFAEELAQKENPTVQLHSTGRVTSCHSVDTTKDQSISYSFIGKGFYYIFPRVIWYSVWVDTEPEPSAVVITTVDTKQTWDGPVIDKSKLNIDYATALQLARERGGADFEQEHATCWLVVELFQNQWLFTYKVDINGIQGAELKRCVDATSGDSCANPPEWWRGDMKQQ